MMGYRRDEDSYHTQEQENYGTNPECSLHWLSRSHASRAYQAKRSVQNEIGGVYCPSGVAPVVIGSHLFVFIRALLILVE
jgi:hypothetical protein